jgi:hypothetical protein
VDVITVELLSPPPPLKSIGCDDGPQTASLLPPSNKAARAGLNENMMRLLE